VLRALGLGDLLTAVPALRALRTAHPEHRLVLATPSELEPLVRLAGVAEVVLDVHGVSALPPGLAWSDPARPELAVNLHGRGPQSHRLLSALRPGRLVAYGCPAAGLHGPRWDEEEHEAHRWCRLVSEGFGMAADPTDLLLPSPPLPPPVAGAVVVHPGAAFPARRWPVERFAEVARWATERGVPVAVTGSEAERPLTGRLRRLADLPASADLAGRTGLLELAALVAAARLVVCGDTGVGHLASAFGTPSVVLFGPTPPSRWGPPTGGPHEVVWHGSETGDPWGAQVDPALLRVGVDEVLDRAESLL
jgi:ADP-heptose:LPS heptosyltransferase